MAIIADAGAMGGSDSTEYQAPAAVGEDTIAYTAGGYAANIEMAKSIDSLEVTTEEPKEIEKVHTPVSRQLPP